MISCIFSGMALILSVISILLALRANKIAQDSNVIARKGVMAQQEGNQISREANRIAAMTPAEKQAIDLARKGGFQSYAEFLWRREQQEALDRRSYENS